jgi:hypothetical protein
MDFHVVGGIRIVDRARYKLIQFAHEGAYIGMLSGEILMSHLLSPVLCFEIHAEPMLKPCAEGKNMANST